MSSPQNVVEAVYTRLTGDSTLNTSLGGTASTAGRVYHQLARQNDTLPLLIFDVLDVRILRAFAGGISYETLITRLLRLAFQWHDRVDA